MRQELMDRLRVEVLIRRLAKKLKDYKPYDPLYRCIVEDIQWLIRNKLNAH